MRSVRLVVIALLFWLVLLQGCSDEKKDVQQAPQAPPPLPVDFVSVAKEQVPIWVEFTGKTEATKRVDVRARVSGRLEQTLFKEGDFVKKGDVLFVLEKDQYEAALSQAKAQLLQNRATLTLAKKDVERYEPLVAEELAPRATLDQYQARVAELEAVIKANEAAVREAELQLSYTDVVAPISGRVSRRLVDEGNIVGYGEPTLLTTIIDDNPMYAYFNPTEREFQVMRKYKSQDKMTARVTIQEAESDLLSRTPLTGQVDFSDNRIDQRTGTISMRAEVANPDHLILEGTFVYVEVMVTDKASFLMVPPGVIQEDQRSSFVYVVDEQNKAKRVDIVRGYENRHYVLVPEGLNDGDKLIMSGLAKVTQGKDLQPVDKTETSGVRARLAEQGMLENAE